MQVWIGYECYFNGCDEWRSAVKVFDDEVKAFVWKEEVEPYEFCGSDYWRDYQVFEVE
jgi:hypothetical protein